MHVIKRHERSFAMRGVESNLLQTPLQIGVLRTPSPIFVGEAIGLLELLVADQDHRSETALEPVPNPLIRPGRIERARLHAEPDDHRRQFRVAVVGPDRQEVHVVEADVVDLAAQERVADIVDEPAIEGQPGGLLHDHDLERNGTVHLVACEVSGEMRDELGQVLLPVSIGHDDSKPFHAPYTPAHIRPGLSTPFGSKPCLTRRVRAASASSCVANTSVTARTAAGARMRVACPPQAATARPMSEAPASSDGGSMTQMSPPAQSYSTSASAAAIIRTSSAPCDGAVTTRQ